MALKTWATDAGHPALIGFLQAHAGDRELETLTATYKAAQGKLDVHNGRREEVDGRLAEIDRLLVDAGAKERASLLTKRGGLAADIASLPSQLATLRERRKAAHLAFLKKVAEVARTEADTLHAQIVGPWAGVVTVRKEITVIDSSYDQGSSEKQAARASLVTENLRQVSELLPLIEARDAAIQVSKVAEVRAQQSYADNSGRNTSMFNLYRPGTWQGQGQGQGQSQ